MDCTEFLERYSEYDDSFVAADEAERFRAHMAACDGCARYDRVLRKGRMLARQLPAPAPSRDFVPRLHMRLWRERTHAARPRPRIPVMAMALPAATIVVALTALLGVASAPDGSGVPPVVSSTTTSTTTSTTISTTTSTYSVHSGGVARAGAGDTGRAVALPAVRLAAGAARPIGWTAPRVDPEASGSYSPLTMGPPAYGGAKSRLGVALTTYPSPD